MLSLIKYKQKPSVDYCTKYPAFTFDTYDDLSVTYIYATRYQEERRVDM